MAGQHWRIDLTWLLKYRKVHLFWLFWKVYQELRPRFIVGNILWRWSLCLYVRVLLARNLTYPIYVADIYPLLRYYFSASSVSLKSILVKISLATRLVRISILRKQAWPYKIRVAPSTFLAHSKTSSLKSLLNTHIRPL